MKIIINPLRCTTWSRKAILRFHLPSGAWNSSGNSLTCLVVKKGSFNCCYPSGSHYGCGSWGDGVGVAWGSALISRFSEFFYQPYHKNDKGDADKYDGKGFRIHFFSYLLINNFAKIKKSLIFTQLS